MFKLRVDCDEFFFGMSQYTSQHHVAIALPSPGCVSLGGSVCIFFSISRLLLRLRLIILHEYILCHQDHKYTSLWFLIISEETLSFIFFHNPTRCNNILVPALCKVSRNSLFPISMR